MVHDSRNIDSNNIDLNKVAKIVVDYYETLISSPDVNVDPENLISCQLSAEEREVLYERISDVDFLYNLTSPLRDAQTE